MNAIDRPLSPPPHLMQPEETTNEGTAQFIGVDPDFQARLISALKTVYDPEIPVDIYELGLIYKLEVKENGLVEIDMTLTTPGCPVAGEMPGRVAAAVEMVEGISEAKVTLVWMPPWDRSRMSEEARVALNMF